MSILTYRDLEVWNQGMDLVEECYRLTTNFPKSELFGLTSQLRRAAVSIQQRWRKAPAGVKPSRTDIM